jgi:hypothetical protein
MELFTKLFGSWLSFIYHCFDRVVLSGYLMGLQRPGQVVYWLRGGPGSAAIGKAELQQRTTAYVKWVESYARKRKIPLEWAERGVKKEEYVRPYLRRMERAGQFGVYFIFQASEQGWTFRPGRTVRQPDGSEYPILHKHRSRYRFYYFYLRDEVLGPMIVRMGTFIPFEASYWINGHSYVEGQLQKAGVAYRKDDNALVWVEDEKKLQEIADGLSPETIQKRLNYWTFLLGPKFSKEDRRAAKLERSYYLHQVEYSQNFIFRKHHPIRTLFERSCELGLWRLTGDKIVELFGGRRWNRINGKLQTTMERVEQGRHVFRAYWKHAWVKQYEKYRTFLRNEITSNNLRDFQMKKGLAQLGAVREKFTEILDRFAGRQAENLNVHGEFALLRRMAMPIGEGSRRVAGIRVQDVRMMRLLQVLLHSGVALGGWTAKQIHQAVLDRFDLCAESYGLNSLRYDLRKLKGHGLLERTAGRYCYRLTEKGQRAAVLLVLFHQRLCGPLASGQFEHRPEEAHRPASKLEAAYYRADRAVDKIVDLLRAA